MAAKWALHTRGQESPHVRPSRSNALTEPYSFSITAYFLPCAVVRMWFSRVVLPEPRKPASKRGQGEGGECRSCARAQEARLPGTKRGAQAARGDSSGRDPRQASCRARERARGAWRSRDLPGRTCQDGDREPLVLVAALDNAGADGRQRGCRSCRRRCCCCCCHGFRRSPSAGERCAPLLGRGALPASDA